MRRKSAFTLIELLVVIAILSILATILLPTVARARELGKAARCMTNLHGIGQGLVLYQETNRGFVVPSYNMPKPGTYAAAVGDLVDGWAVILERDALVPASQGPTDNLFYCPNTGDTEGMLGGQTGYDLDKPLGYQDWPIKFLTGGGDSATKGHPDTLPAPGFGDANGLYSRMIRCGYFLNAYNPIGSAPTGKIPACTAYTWSVGYGPYTNGSLPPLRPNIKRPSALIVACDGMYMGRQTVTRIGEQNRRVGYRHLGTPITANVNGTMMGFDKTITNAVFADGHADSIHNNDFPHSNVPAENDGKYSLLPDH